jgi:N-acetylglucosamine-6-phosphate deacetylase
MPSAIIYSDPTTPTQGRHPRITKFTNCRILKGKSLIEADLWIDSHTGTIVRDQEAFYEWRISPDQVVDLQGRILAPGLIDCQLNGAQGFDYSIPCETREEYETKWKMSNQGLVNTGVTSYLPTMVSSTKEAYWKVSVFF